MCGIAGIRKMGAIPIRGWQLTLMANRLEYRGNDATGVAFMYKDGHTAWLKDHQPAWGFTSSQAYKTFIREKLTPDVVTALVHTRRWTKGSSFQNNNNHPIVHPEKPAGIIVHNGVISNDDELFKSNPEFNRGCLTDSDAIRAILDFHGGISKDTKLIPDLCKLEGAVASALIHPATPDKLLLLRDNNPLMIGYTKDFIFFASDKRAIHEAAKPFVKLHGIIGRLHAPGLAFLPMPNESAWIIGPNGIEYHAPFKCAGFNQNRGNISYVERTDYHERTARAKRMGEVEAASIVSAANIDVSSLPGFVLCLGNDCFHHIPITDEHRKNGLDKYRCKNCQTPLSKSLPVPSAIPVVH